ncbi:MAG: GGDEF domain-containing protein, partial [Gemmobacter sp.]|nr:GGDEF domain-containing protein [Gemmobacter sp.]
MSTPSCLDPAMLGLLMPMHVTLDAHGTIGGAGPTLVRLMQGPPDGQSFFDLFEIRRPSGITDPAELAQRAGQRLFLVARNLPATPFRGVMVPRIGGGMMLNLSFGIGIVEAVRDHGLTHADFAPTDLAMELLYLVEAKSAIMEELRALNLRLQGAKSMAEEQALTDTLTGL